jgi:hypothetical protein
MIRTSPDQKHNKYSIQQTTELRKITTGSNILYFISGLVTEYVS